jgi:hypothetical protein
MQITVDQPVLPQICDVKDCSRSFEGMKIDSFILSLHLVSADFNLITVYQSNLDWTLQQAAQTRLYSKQHKEN